MIDVYLGVGIYSTFDYYQYILICGLLAFVFVVALFILVPVELIRSQGWRE